MSGIYHYDMLTFATTYNKQHVAASKAPQMLSCESNFKRNDTGQKIGILPRTDRLRTGIRTQVIVQMPDM